MKRSRCVRSVPLASVHGHSRTALATAWYASKDGAHTLADPRVHFPTTAARRPRRTGDRIPQGSWKAQPVTLRADQLHATCGLWSDFLRTHREIPRYRPGHRTVLFRSADIEAFLTPRWTT